MGTNLDHINPFGRQQVAEEYDSWFETPLGRTVERLERRLLWRLAQPRAGEHVLDVGTGTGHWACALAELGATVTGLDSSEAMLGVASRKSRDVRWELGSAESLPYADSSYDLVLSVTALEFVRAPEQVLAEMYRVLAPGGRLVVGVLNAAGPWGRAYTELAQQADVPYRYAHFYTADELARLLGRWGRPAWNSAVFVAPSGRGMRFSGLIEFYGQLCKRREGALLVGRVMK